MKKSSSPPIPNARTASPRTKVHADFHCVTRWSRLDKLWEGVSTRHLLELAGGVKPDCTHVLAHGFDGSWTTNLPLAEFLSEDALVALTHDGEPLTLEHGAPARLIVPLFEFLSAGRAAFWERNGYFRHGDPWREERFGW